MLFFFFKQKTAYEMRISDWSSDVCSSDLAALRFEHVAIAGDDQCHLLVGDDHHRFQIAQIFIGAPVLGEFDRGAEKLAVVAFELGLEPLEQGEGIGRSEEHTSELQSLMSISYAVFCLEKRNRNK